MDYAEFVAGLTKDGADIQVSISAAQLDLWHAATGVSGEAGELLDAVKKHVVYNKPLDLENVIEELGDLRFYMQAIANNLEITEEEILQHNLQKLGRRYASGSYSDQQAQDRADKRA